MHLTPLPSAWNLAVNFRECMIIPFLVIASVLQRLTIILIFLAYHLAFSLRVRIVHGENCYSWQARLPLTTLDCLVVPVALVLGLPTLWQKVVSLNQVHELLRKRIDACDYLLDDRTGVSRV